MKKKYCKFCGRELENGSCNCNYFLYAKNQKSYKIKICDTCHKKIDADSIYCTYCGIPQNVDGNIKELQRELKGHNALDVLEVYKKMDEKEGIRHSKVNQSIVGPLISLALVASIFLFLFNMFLWPILRERIIRYQIRKNMEAAVASETLLSTYDIETAETVETTEETTQPVLELRDMWVRRDGFIYSFDKNGDPVVDDWVTEIDENGEEQKYYFDIDGKLVVNSWIDGEYYVGPNGAMLKNTDTPDGASVDEEGRVILKGENEIEVTRETYVYYESPNSTETVEASNMRSSNSGEIRGVDPNKTYELYVQNIRQERDTIMRGDLRCNITYYVPVMAGADEREVQIMNAGLEEAFVKFNESLKDKIKGYPDLPKSLTFNVVEQRNLNSNRMIILLHGKLMPRRGLTEKMKYRFIYDRKSRKVLVADITD